MLNERSQSRKRKKLSPFAIVFRFFLVVFAIIGIIYLYNKYSLTTERADLYEYIGSKDNEVAIYLNDKKDFINGKQSFGLCQNDATYLSLSYVHEKLNERFYYASDIKKILYSLIDTTLSYGETDIHQVGNAPYVLLKDEPYILVDFVKDHTNIRFEQYLEEENKRIYIYTDWVSENIAYFKNSEAARVRGGNKSPIVVDCKKGEEVKILTKDTKWSKVKTKSGYIGYVRNTRLNNEMSFIPESSYIEEKRDQISLQGKVVLGWHQVASQYASNRITELVKNAKDDMNVIAPTWFTIRNNSGEIRSIANIQYTSTCHQKGMKVWGVLDNFNLGELNNKKIFSNTLTRKKMITKILREVEVNNLDGINLDIENLKESEGEDYMQFVRELSIEMLKINKTLSVDTYVPFHFNVHYNLSELNHFCDYVIIMCYDEYYSGSKTAGSVSSIGYVNRGIEETMKEVSSNKIVIGVPFYTRIWVTDVDGQVTSVALDSKTAYDDCKKRGIEFAFDEETEQNYGSIVDAKGKKAECWLEDETSLKFKAATVRAHDLAGMAAWKLTQEQPEFFKIINLNKNEY